ncbi:hypothetical protein [Actinomadura rugatobispora]|uniref:Tetratricopeptide repeat protein n=1 Tax=Actinomadura rugatobispora TaxID=1994 RepID=A0ABW1A0A5_9ACTN|nr:hypothetical protein GCM10010200_029760 [Actinomadura rugatobispora]
MTYTAAELSGLLAEADDMPPGEAQVDAVRDVVRHAEAAGLLDVEIEARLALVDALMLTAENADDVNAIVTAFTRCVGLYTAHPDRFDDDLLDMLWRQFAAQGIVLTLMVVYPLRLVRGVFDDMEGRCRPDRDDLHTVHSIRLLLAEVTGDAEMGERALATLRHREPPQYACPACLSLYQVRYLASLGRDAEAIAVAQPIITGETPCDTDSQPADVLQILQNCYLRTGDLEEARDAHRLAYRGLDHDDEFDVAQHLRFCVLSGNTERGLEIFRQHLRLLEDTPTVLYELELASASALLFRTLVEAGRGEEVLIWPANPDVPDEEDEEWTFADLHEDLLRDVTELAGRYDERSGNTHLHDRMHAIIQETPLVDELPLSPLAARRKQIEQTPTELPEIADALKEDAPFEESPLDKALAHARQGEDLLNSGSADRAIGEFIEAAARFTALGDTRLAAFARVDLSTAYLTVGRHLDAAECAEEALPDVPPEKDAEYTGMQARWVLACAYPELGQSEDALRMLAEMTERATEPGTLGRVAKKEGEILGALDRDDEAAARYTEAASQFAKTGDLFEEAVCLRQAALAHSWAGDLDEALAFAERSREVVKHLPHDEERSTWELAVLQYDRARILATHDRTEEAATEAELAAETFRETTDRAFVTRCELMAAKLWYDLGTPAHAKAALERALHEPAEDNDHQADLTEAQSLLDDLR